MLKKIIFKIDWNLNKFGISIATFIYNDFANIKLLKNKKKTNIFQKIYKSNFWKSDESASGHGSTLHRASPYLERLKKFLKKKKIKIFLDAPCGDLNWINFLSIKNMKYIGADIVPELIYQNQTKYPQNKFLILDIRKDKLPKADLLHCRDCLFHFSYSDILKTIQNFQKSNIKYFLITSHEGFFKNNDITTGGSRFLSLTKKPFFFPQPIFKIKDFPVFEEMPRYLYLYKKEDLKKIV